MDVIALTVGIVALIGLLEWVRRVSVKARAKAVETARGVAAETARGVAAEVARETARKVAAVQARRVADARIAEQLAADRQAAFDVAHAAPAPGVPTVKPKRLAKLKKRLTKLKRRW